MPLADNRVVALYSMESPEVWFEDFGGGQLREGVAEIALEPTFAQTVNTENGDFRVFLTPNGDCQGLYVARKTAASFEVRELGGGKSSVAFDYRIVAKRRGYEAVRLQEAEADAQTVEALRQQQRPPGKLTVPKPTAAEQERPRPIAESARPGSGGAGAGRR